MIFGGWDFFTIAASEPWRVEQLPIAELPPEWEGYTVAAVEGTLLVGGHTRNGEALWSRHGAGSVPWVEIPLPEFVRQYGKAGCLWAAGHARGGCEPPARVKERRGIAMTKVLYLYGSSADGFRAVVAEAVTGDDLHLLTFPELLGHADHPPS